MPPQECDAIYERVCKGRFDHIDRKLDRIDKVLRGDPEDDEAKPGIMDRLRQIERIERSRRRMLWAIAGAAAAAFFTTLGKLLAGR